MGDRSRIEWTNATWNPLSGCTKVSAGCKFCYAERDFHRPYPGRDFTEIQLHPDRLDQPLRWKRPRRIFVCSMGDLFHEAVPDEFIADAFGVMAVCAQSFMCGKEKRKQRADGVTVISMASDVRYGPHTFQVLTKRPERMHTLLKSTRFRGAVSQCAYKRAYNRTDAGYLAHQIDTREEYGRCYEPGGMWPLPNVHIGVSVENQATADERIPLLLQTPAAVRFVSYEPALGPVDFEPYFEAVCTGDPQGISGNCEAYVAPGIDWLICGGESGPQARPMHPDWARSVRDQCQAAGVPFFFKQWGEWRPVGPHDEHPGCQYERGKTWLDGDVAAFRMGKKSAGRIIDGRTWDEFPQEKGA